VNENPLVLIEAITLRIKDYQGSCEKKKNGKYPKKHTAIESGHNLKNYIGFISFIVEYLSLFVHPCVGPYTKKPAVADFLVNIIQKERSLGTIFISNFISVQELSASIAANFGVVFH
jgi:pyoverdine/dityrosine biosynthesis protein Dit1